VSRPSSFFKTIALIFIANISLAQNFLNGSFEINTAVSDQINLANAPFNGFMSNVNSWGTTPNLDIIQSATWGGGGAQHCKWYVALTGSGTDAFNMTLSAPLVTGQTYTISFYDRKDGAWNGFPIQLGLSTNNNSIGTIIYTAPVGATTNVWTQRTFTFVAPNNGQYISVIQNAGTTQTWVHVDNFVMNNNTSSGSLNIAASATTICQGSSAVFTVTGASTYTWNPSATLSSANASVVTATPPTTTTYSVTGNAGGCIYTGSITLNVIPPPAVTVTPVTSNICAGKSVTLTATGATSFTWGPATGLSTTTGSVVVATPAVTTNYTVTGGAGTCTSSAVAAVNITPSPTITINSVPATSVCAGSSATLTASGATSYTWSTGAFSPNISVSPASNTTYTVTGINSATGCTNTATQLITVVPLPVPNANSNSAVCVGNTLNLLGNGGTTYSWQGPNSFNSPLQNPTISGVTAAAAGTYTLTVSAAGCSASVTTNVSITPPPVPVANNNSPVCSGGTLNLFGNGGTVYGWSGPGYSGLNQNPVINNVTTAASGVYTLVVGVGSCTAATTTSVTINPLPVFNFAGSNVLCNGQSNGTSTVNVTVGTGPFNYNWSTIPSQTTQDANGLAAGTYSCTVTDANGCTSVNSTQISQPGLFTVSINSSNTSACAGSPINAIANGNGGTGPYNYNWVSGPSSNVYSINESVDGNYNYTVNATDAFNCPATAFVNLTFFPQPTVTATSGTICSGQTTAITASGANTYIWQPGNVTGPTYTYNGVVSTNVSVIGTANGCSNSANANITVNTLPSANIAISGTKGCVPACVTYTGSGSGSAPITDYGWTINGAGISGNSQDGSYCFDKPATYTLGLIVTDANGCSGLSGTSLIDIYPQPVADFNHSPIKPIVNIDQEVTFTDASYNTPIVSWNWYFMNTAQYTSVEQNPTFSYTEPGTYVVALIVKSDKGCSDTLLRPIVVGEDYAIYVPNAFTPNADGINDIFQPKGFGIVKYEMNIFDRWGEKVFSTKDFEKGWDGTMQSKHDVKYGILEEGTYTWLIDLTNVYGKSHELKGHVILLK
jgi:gliding motility-associated-like protein